MDRDRGLFSCSPPDFFSFVCARLGIPVFFPNFGGTGACSEIVFQRETIKADEYDEHCDVFNRFISIEEKGTHLSNLGLRRQTTGNTLANKSCTVMSQ
jgi:hypothetical protein